MLQGTRTHHTVQLPHRVPPRQDSDFLDLPTPVSIVHSSGLLSTVQLLCLLNNLQQSSSNNMKRIIDAILSAQRIVGSPSHHTD